ncbi:MAG: hypothetical protein Q7U04_15645 [Bacteriovorax sp.]|nr:hypothetical protein [Bacteriovorax sp.]
MKEFKSYIVPLLTLSLCAVLLTGSWFFYLKKDIPSAKSDQFIQDKEALGRLLQNSSEIQKMWTEGEDSRVWGTIKTECLRQFKITSPFDESLLRCNPMLLECNFLFNPKLNYRLVKPETNNGNNLKWYRYLTKSNSAHVGLEHSGFLFTIEDKLSHKHLDLFLADQCQEVFLQKRIYAYGEEVIDKPSEDIEDYRFDNFNQNIYIDRHLVMNSEINDWIDFGNPNFTKGLKKIEDDSLFMPASGLDYNQMENYCSFKGKQILQAHYFDAATFLPSDLTDTTPNKNNRSPYYWTKKKSEFKSDSLDNCALFYAEECQEKKRFQLNSSGPSWAGVLDSMGGIFEVMRNPIDPESNLKASSYYFNFKSSWHKLGFRANWNGEGFELRNFDFLGLNPAGAIDKFKVGFRCMRESQ